jgi:alpha-1,3-glucosyltransferase
VTDWSTHWTDRSVDPSIRRSAVRSVGPLKWRELLGGPSVAVRVALAATVAAALPSMAQQVAAPSAHGFLLACANSAAAVFLFSFQVHEKSVLLPLMPATLLSFALLPPPPGPASSSRAGSSSRALLAALAVWGSVVACFGMFPLLERDGVAAAYAACIVAYVARGRGAGGRGVGGLGGGRRRGE